MAQSCLFKGILAAFTLGIVALLGVYLFPSYFTDRGEFSITDGVIEQFVQALERDRVVVCAHTQKAEDEARCLIKDASPFPPKRADIVVRPKSTEEVSKVLSICHQHSIPVTASGAKTGLEGNNHPMRGGVSVDMMLMNNILELHADDMQVTLQTGMMKTAMQKWCDENGFLLTIDPGSDASIGGYLSTGASGTLTPKYGTVRDNVVRLRVVLPDGRIMWTRSRAKKSSAGYDINRLFLGAEGTLGIITEVFIV